MLLGTFCKETANIWQILGYVVMILKIAIPLILIVLGMVDLGKAVVSSDEKAINKSVGTLIKRFVAAVVIFFIPTIVSAIFGILKLVDTSKESDYNVCVQCVTNVGSCDTTGVVGDMNSGTEETKSGT